MWAKRISPGTRVAVKLTLKTKFRGNFWGFLLGQNIKGSKNQQQPILENWTKTYCPCLVLSSVSMTEVYLALDTDGVSACQCLKGELYTWRKGAPGTWGHAFQTHVSHNKHRCVCRHLPFKHHSVQCKKYAEFIQTRLPRLVQNSPKLLLNFVERKWVLWQFHHFPITWIIAPPPTSYFHTTRPYTPFSLLPLGFYIYHFWFEHSFGGGCSFPRSYMPSTILFQFSLPD